jgi:hypothetical protein
VIPGVTRAGVVRISASNATYAGTVRISGGPNITVGTDASGITMSAAGGTGGGGGSFSAGISNIGNTAGSTGVTGSRLVFAGVNNVSLSQSTDANGATISFDHSLPSFSAGVSTGGNTAGSTGVSGSRLVLVGTNNVTLSQSTDANGATVSIIPRPDVTLPHFMPFPPAFTSASHAQGRLAIFPFPVPSGLVVTATQVGILASVSISTTNLNTLSGTVRVAAAVYSDNAGTLSLHVSGSTDYSWSNSTNNTSLFNGVREFTIPLAMSLSAGQWYGGFWAQTTGGSGTLTLSPYYVSLQSNAFSGRFGSSSNSTRRFLGGWGVYSLAGSFVPPAAISYASILQGSAAGDMRIPFVIFAATTN